MSSVPVTLPRRGGAALRVRLYTPNDLRAVVSLFERAVHHDCAATYTSAQLDAWAPRVPDMAAWTLRIASALVWVCEESGSGIVGFVCVYRHGLIKGPYVEPSRARRGVATRLLQASVAWAHDAGLERLRADVALQSRKFFERQGFHFDGEVVRLRSPGVGMRYCTMHVPVRSTTRTDA